MTNAQFDLLKDGIKDFFEAEIAFLTEEIDKFTKVKNPHVGPGYLKAKRKAVLEVQRKFYTAFKIGTYESHD